MIDKSKEIWRTNTQLPDKLAMTRSRGHAFFALLMAPEFLISTRRAIEHHAQRPSIGGVRPGRMLARTTTQARKPGAILKRRLRRSRETGPSRFLISRYHVIDHSKTRRRLLVTTDEGALDYAHAAVTSRHVVDVEHHDYPVVNKSLAPATYMQHQVFSRPAGLVSIAGYETLKAAVSAARKEFGWPLSPEDVGGLVASRSM